MGELSKALNIGIVVEAQLHEVGIDTLEELKRVGAEQAWLKIQGIDNSVCMQKLLGLEGAIQGIKKTMLPEERKAELRQFYDWHKGDGVWGKQ